MRVRILAGLAAGATLLCAQNQEADQGRALFRSNCAFCHGLNGLGGRGPNLVSGDQRSDDETKSIIRNGVPGSTMPEFSSFTEEQLKRIVVFLHQLRGTTAPEEPVKGDPTAGRAVYEQNGCTTCHQIEGSGGV